MRKDGRAANQMREVKITKDYIRDAEGSCLIEMGKTKVVCTATIEERVPLFLKHSGKGWITAEYGMLPRSSRQRIERIRSRGRIYEIQRLIGRSLRSISNLSVLDGYTIIIDCDVIQADGGTRTASVTGGFIACHTAFQHMLFEGLLERSPTQSMVAAISVGVVNGVPMLDLTYEEDSAADVDMNIVLTDKLDIVELQGTGEKRPYTTDELSKLMNLAKVGIKELIEAERRVLLHTRAG
ncbi:ribonuclease PH [candidate division WOR-3 bacterium JGI_Cruoil_03_44_89]|uniref:Ribonuclease PH n=1 Tax=candidate division WOR-3 bacterium JGI_Cruoil_03_44_89 TaxID=1973748 RepID=A0A235BSZ0_UNCW3|nr:MAG: ribonuclease PH [candidate division WOR-3 bacterium JGI_Cruoil_03_44_89]